MNNVDQCTMKVTERNSSNHDDSWVVVEFEETLGDEMVGEDQSQREGKGERLLITYVLDQPPILDDCNKLEEYMESLDLWERRIEAPKEKMATMVIESLMSSPKFRKGLAAKFGEE